METKVRIVTEDEMAVEDWDYGLYSVNIYAAHATVIQTLAQKEILQSGRLHRSSSWRKFCNKLIILLTVWTPCMCVQIYCVLCVLDFYQINSLL